LVKTTASRMRISRPTSRAAPTALASTSRRRARHSVNSRRRISSSKRRLKFCLLRRNRGGGGASHPPPPPLSPQGGVYIQMIIDVYGCGLKLASRSSLGMRALADDDRDRES